MPSGSRGLTYHVVDPMEETEFHLKGKRYDSRKSERFRYWACANPACGCPQLGGELNCHGEGRSQCRACGWHTFYVETRRQRRTFSLPPDIVRSMTNSEIQALLKGG